MEGEGGVLEGEEGGEAGAGLGLGEGALVTLPPIPPTMPLAYQGHPILLHSNLFLLMCHPLPLLSSLTTNTSSSITSSSSSSSSIINSSSSTCITSKLCMPSSNSSSSRCLLSRKCISSRWLQVWFYPLLQGL